jgi:hypothetical protein
MRPANRFMFLLTSSFLLFGCGPSGSSTPTPSQGEGPFERRFQEVIRVTAEGQRQEALVQIATDAAEAGDTPNTWKALGWMRDPAGRDTAARTCAVKLAALGKRDEAVLIANQQISNAEIKAKTLAEIGESKPDK